jgi:hypothetical protein
MAVDKVYVEFVWQQVEHISDRLEVMDVVESDIPPGSER